MVFFGWYSATLVHATTVVLSPHGNAREFLDGNRPLWYILLRYSATTVGNVWYILYFIFYIFWVTPTCVWCCDANTFTEHENQQTSNLNVKCVLCVCVCFLPIYSGRQIRWKYQPVSHKDFSSAPSFCGACLYFSREKDSAVPFPRRP